MKPFDLKQEARFRQGKTIPWNERSLQITGEPHAAEFASGREGLVQLAIDPETGEKYRIKCFWDPDDRRRRRSEHLVNQRLANPNKYKADALGGAPVEMLVNLGPCTPFALVMRNVRGENWDTLKNWAHGDEEYPPRWWPPVTVRATWAYGLATAVKQMEAKEFIHSDLSRGNVVLSDGLHGVVSSHNGSPIDDEFVGDMALVDFDRFIQAQVDPPAEGQGSKGFAAKEVWEGKRPELGSDRTSMAILIQEFLVTGDPDVSRDQAFAWIYDQDKRQFGISASGEQTEAQALFRVHPLLSKKYPAMAALVEDTIRANRPLGRPEPQLWRDVLRPIAEPPSGEGRPVTQFAVEEVTEEPTPYRASLGLAQKQLDLSSTRLNIRASLKRDGDGSVFLYVHEGASIEMKDPGKKEWTTYVGNTRVEIKHGTEVRDKNAPKTARVLGHR